MWCKTCFDILNRLGVDHECEGQTDRQSSVSNNAVILTQAKSTKTANLGEPVYTLYYRLKEQPSLNVSTVTSVISAL